ncbi:IPT/TIG domain-containing protein [Myxococcota bacterium]|nr:IPT/TIG domain-containing protein [Myxococcota bacterium]
MSLALRWPARPFALSSALTAALAACTSPGAGELDALDETTSLYRLVTTVDGTSFHPPLGPAPTPTGTFDSSLLGDLRVVLEGVSSDGAILTSASFDRATSPAIKLFSAHQVYFVDVPAAQFITNRSLEYRFRVLLSERELGRSDLSSHVFTVLDKWPALRVGVKLRIESRAAPQLEVISPATSVAGSGDLTLTVDGTRFSSDSVVRFGETALATTHVSDRRLTALLPGALLGAARDVSISVSTPAPGGGSSATVPLRVQNAVPVIDALSPASAFAGGAGFTLTIDGASFVPGATVSFGALELPATFVSASRVTASIPASAVAVADTYSVSVMNPSPTPGASEPLPFSVTSPVPVLSSISPSGAGAGGAGFTMTLTGSAFMLGARVTLNGAALATSWVSATQLLAVVPAIAVATPGAFPVVVTNPAPSGRSSAALALTVRSGCGVVSPGDPYAAQIAINIDFNCGAVNNTGSAPVTLGPSPLALSGAGGVGGAGFASGFAVGSAYIAPSTPIFVGDSGRNTFVAWYRGTQQATIGGSGYQTGVVIYGDPAGSVYLGLGVDAGRISIANSNVVRGTTNVSDGNWHQLVWVRSGTTWSGYVDGVQEFTNFSAYVGTSYEYIRQIGSGYPYGPVVGPAALDDLRVYGVALTAGEVRGLYRTGVPIVEVGATPFASCYDGLLNNAETAIDCGGDTCAPCVGDTLVDLSFDAASAANGGRTTVTAVGTLSFSSSDGVANGGYASGFSLGTTYLDNADLAAGDASGATYSAWYRGTQMGTVASGSQPAVVIFGDPSATAALGLGVDDGRVAIANTTITRGISNVADGNWHHLVWVRQGTTWNVYVDDVREIENVSVTHAPGSQFVRAIGSGAMGDQTVAPSALDGVAIYGVALTANHVHTLYLAGLAGLVPPGSSLPRTCTNGTLDGTETGVDCGGACLPCAGAALVEVTFDNQSPANGGTLSTVMTGALTFHASGGVAGRGYASGFGMSGPYLDNTDVYVGDSGTNTFMAWYRGTQQATIGGSGYQPGVVIFGDQAGTVYLGLGVDAGRISIADQNVVRGTTNVADGNWHLLVWTRQGTVWDAWVDGVQEVSGFVAAVAPSYQYIRRIGSGYPYSPVVSPSALDNIRVYASVLTRAQISAMYQQQR